MAKIIFISGASRLFGKIWAEAFLKRGDKVVVGAENPPLHMLLGKKAYPWVKQVYQARFAEWDAWNEVAVAAPGY